MCQKGGHDVKIKLPKVGHASVDFKLESCGGVVGRLGG